MIDTGILKTIRTLRVCTRSRCHKRRRPLVLLPKDVESWRNINPFRIPDAKNVAKSAAYGFPKSRNLRFSGRAVVERDDSVLVASDEQGVLVMYACAD